MGERPTHEDFIQGKSLNQKLTSAFNAGYTHIVSFNANKKESRYFVRSLQSAMVCKSSLSALGVSNALIIQIEG